MRNELFALWLLFGTIPMATAQVSVEINLPGASIGINQPVYPDLVAVPGYPVYYAPQVNSNYFFYDGMYWVYARDNWYASSWYNGPWGLVGPDAVPLFILRVPVQYYREPPAYFHGWSSDAAPRWDDHWGNAWTQRRQGWDTWDHAAIPAAAPLPTYQRQYSGRTYPAVAQQQVLQTQNYRYQPKEVVVHQAAQVTPVKPAPASQAKPTAPQARNATPQAQHGSMPVSPPQQSAAASHRGQPPKPAGEEVQRSAAEKASPQAATTAKETKQQPKQAVAHAQPQAQKAQPQNKAPAPEPKVAHQAQPAPQAVAQHQAPRAPEATAQHREAEPKSQEKAPQGKEPAQEARPGQEKG